MKIRIEEFPDHYRADCLDLPGSPPTGQGKTKELAVAHLMWLIVFTTTDGGRNYKWSEFLELTKEEPIEVNGVVWELPYDCTR